MEPIDFTPLLANEENGRDMLSLLAEQTKKDMESLRRVHDHHDRWKSHATLTLLAKQDCPPFGYNMITPFGQNSIDHLAQLLL